jgi:hypothetical protein
LAAQSAVNYHPIKSKSGSLPAASGARESFDYLTVDVDARRVYAAHGMEVDVLDADDTRWPGRIGGLQLCHAVVVLKALSL